MTLVVAAGLASSWCALGGEGPEAPGAGAGDRADGFFEGDGPSLFRPGNRYGWGGEDPFYDEVLPLFAKRCATCHGCVDSPCQLKLTSYEGIRRGSNEQNIFNEPRLSSIAQTRLQDGRVVDGRGLVDHQATEGEWRRRGFYSVVDGGERSVMAALLDEAHDLAPEGGLSRARLLYEDGLRSRNFVCVGEGSARAGLDPAEMEGRAMPFGCPAIEDEHYDVLAEWLEAGGPGPSREAQAVIARPVDQAVVDRWEAFFNQEGDQAELASRYLYEHLFFARIHFPEAPGDYYELVRSWTPPGRPIEEIVTRRVTDDPARAPGARPGARVHYRLRKLTEVIVEKNHITWPLDEATRARWLELFHDSDWGDGPIEGGYATSNPFESFAAIPAPVRARFVLESSYRLIDAMVRGDVCTGSTATWAIRDLFWVFFLDPAADPSAQDPRLGEGSLDHLTTGQPGATTSRERRYLDAFERSLRALRPEGLGLEDLWTGDGSPEDAMVTVLRHGESATVHRGAQGGFPATFWVLSFANFERLYYTLVVDFDPWASSNHQLQTWQYMSFIRADGEDLFLSLLPEEHRSLVRDDWTRSFGRFVHELFFGMPSEGRPSRVVVDDRRPVEDLVEQVLDHLGPEVAGPPDPLNAASGPDDLPPRVVRTAADFEQGLATLTGWRAPFARYLPNVTLLRFGGPSGLLYTIVANRGYAFHDVILFEDLARDPEQDSLSVFRGLVGARPELFVDVPEQGAAELLEELRAVRSEDDWSSLVFDRLGSARAGHAHFVRRDDPELWSFLDWLHEWNVAHRPEDSGLLDLAEYVWPDLVRRGAPAGDDGHEPNDGEAEAVALPPGSHRLVVCDEDWFAFEVDRPGVLAVEVAFDGDEGDVDIALRGPGVSTASESWTTDYEAITAEVRPGRYLLRVDLSMWSRGCQHYTLFASVR